MRRPRVEILSFAGCPNAEPARALVEEVSRELRLEPEIRLVDVSDSEAARRLRFPGSPTVRVDGRDVDPQAAQSEGYGLGCRVFRTAAGLARRPDEQWVRDALLRASNDSRRRR